MTPHNTEEILTSLFRTAKALRMTQQHLAGELGVSLYALQEWKRWHDGKRELPALRSRSVRRIVGWLLVSEEA